MTSVTVSGMIKSLKQFVPWTSSSPSTSPSTSPSSTNTKNVSKWVSEPTSIPYNDPFKSSSKQNPISNHDFQSKPDKNITLNMKMDNQRIGDGLRTHVLSYTDTCSATKMCGVIRRSRSSDTMRRYTQPSIREDTSEKHIKMGSEDTGDDMMMNSEDTSIRYPTEWILDINTIQIPNMILNTNDISIHTKSRGRDPIIPISISSPIPKPVYVSNNNVSLNSVYVSTVLSTSTVLNHDDMSYPMDGDVYGIMTQIYGDTVSISNMSTHVLRVRDIDTLMRCIGLPRYVWYLIVRRVKGEWNMCDDDETSVRWCDVSRIWIELKWNTNTMISNTLSFLNTSSKDNVSRVFIHDQIQSTSTYKLWTLLVPPIRHKMIPSDLYPLIHLMTRYTSVYEFLVTSGTVFWYRFIETVVTRIWYNMGKSWCPILTYQEYIKLKLIDMMKKMDDIETCIDGNIPDVFGYKDFYVMYCRYWETDMNRDDVLGLDEIERFDGWSVNREVIERVIWWCQNKRCVLRNIMECDRIEGYGNNYMDKITCTLSVRTKTTNMVTMNNTITKKKRVLDRYMTYTDFIPYIISLMDKTTNTALSYWFHVLDTDHDGVISWYEINKIWKTQMMRVKEWYGVGDLVNMMDDVLRLGTDNETHENDDGKWNGDQGCGIRLLDLKRNRYGAELILDLVFDMRRRCEHVRRCSDIQYRRRDEVWMDIPNHENQGGMGGKGDIKKVLLRGWNKYSEKWYRELTMPETVSNPYTNIVTSSTPSIGSTTVSRSTTSTITESVMGISKGMGSVLVPVSIPTESHLGTHDTLPIHDVPSNIITDLNTNNDVDDNTDITNQMDMVT